MSRCGNQDIAGKGHNACDNHGVLEPKHGYTARQKAHVPSAYANECSGFSDLQEAYQLRKIFNQIGLSFALLATMVFLSHFTTFWKQTLHIVQPDTLLRWHWELFGMSWRKKSQGKPKISAETMVLIKKLAKENLWGAERIRGELLKPGIEVSK